MRCCVSIEPCPGQVSYGADDTRAVYGSEPNHTINLNALENDPVFGYPRLVVIPLVLEPRDPVPGPLRVAQPCPLGEVFGRAPQGRGRANGGGPGGPPRPTRNPVLPPPTARGWIDLP